MRSKLALLCLASALAGCAANGQDMPSRGVAAVNVPVVTRQDYAVDLNAADGTLSPTEAARLDGWFRGLELGYGDTVYVDSAYGMAREDIARIAGQYGMLVTNGAPVTAGQVAPGNVRVVVSRSRASVPGCPNWDVRSQPNWDNATMSNFGCAVNANLAAMVANPDDLVRGREGSGVTDTATAAKAVDYYRKTPPTGTTGLQDITTKKGKQ